jgi:hypothetical protein
MGFNGIFEKENSIIFRQSRNIDGKNRYHFRKINWKNKRNKAKN